MFSIMQNLLVGLHLSIWVVLHGWALEDGMHDVHLGPFA